MSKVFHNPLSLHGADSEKEKKGSSNEDADPSPSSSTVDLRAPTPLLDPSTNTNPLQDDTDILGPQEHAPGSLEDEKRQATVAHETLTSRDVSKHTFYIVNSQMRLKLVAGTNVSNV
jgi:phospholipase D1/2